MEYKIELKPFEEKEGVKYIVLKLTDYQLHTSAMKPSPLGKNIKKSIESNQPVRIYSSLPKRDPNNTAYKLKILDFVKNDPVLIKTVRDYESQGYKILIEIPKEGLLGYAGKDTNEFINSVKGKRILRMLAKDKQQV